MLPNALVSSDDYRALPDRAQRNLAGSLDYCKEMADKAISAHQQSRASLLELLDDIELDAFSILNSATPEAKISPYRVHSSWTAECNQSELSSVVRGELETFLNRPAALFGRAEKDIQNWLQEWGVVIERMLLRFEKSTTFTEAVAGLIAIDALLASFLVFAASVRLSSRISCD